VQQQSAASPAYGSPPTWTWLVLRGLGAITVVAFGIVHLQQYLGPYSAIPTIGTLFLFNFAAATTVAAVLLAPVEHAAGRWAGVVVAVASSGGIVLAATSYLMLFISERRPLFGFQEPGYDPTAIATSRGFEIAAIVLLGASLLLRFATKGPKHRW
jgi:hypothetical protein